MSTVKKIGRSTLSYLTRQWFMSVFYVLSLLILLFVLVPIFKMVFLSDKSALFRSLTDTTIVNSITLSLYAALITTIIGFVLGVPLAYTLARKEFPMKSAIEGLIDLPIVVPHTAAGIALLFVFGRNFLVGRWFNSIGIQFVDSLAGIVVAMLFVSIPFMIDSAKEGFKRVDVRLENAARTLGASPWQVFYRITFPLAWRSVLAGGMMMWARGISEFGAVVILTYYPMVAPTLIYQQFESYGLTSAIPVAALLIIVCAIVFVGVRVLTRRRTND